MTDPPPFNVCGELPTGTTVLEASAGTGKTFTIAALAARYVAEGHAQLGELMLVTFGRAATQELRGRVRERLVTAARALADPTAARAGSDDLARLLANADDAEVTTRRKRLTTALADFDAATIATTHAFSSQMLVGLGMAGSFEPDAMFVEDIGDLVAEVAGDLYLRRWGRPDADPPLLSYDGALSLARIAVGDRHAVIEPRDAEPDSNAAVRVGLATAVRAEVDRRQRQRRLRDYDDLLTRLRDALVDAEHAAAALARIRSRYRVVMVDEFQDTDPVQWQILQTAFHGHVTLVLIGDPKQAIYAFRGGDVVTYLAAREAASSEATLGTNWRSDEALLDGLGHVFAGAALGDPGIVVRPVASAHPSRRLAGAPVAAPVRVRALSRAVFGEDMAAAPKVGDVRPAVARDVAAETVRLLDSGAKLDLADGSRPVAAGDIAVLVHTNDQATMVHQALQDCGVPAVLTGAVNVFGTPMAQEWVVLLEALEQPHRSTRARAAALGRFVGWDVARLATASDDELDELGAQLSEWSSLLARRGVPALLEKATADGRLLERLLAHPQGERQLTDLRHIGEALHTAAVAEQLGVSALVEWLHRRICDAREKRDQEERSRRLESDAAAVQVVTVHRSKGLEFPVVFVPYGWDRWTQGADYPRFHEADSVRRIDLGGKGGPGFDEHCAIDAAEQAGESLRLLYVALTRAECQVVAWWAPSTATACAPLHRLLFGAFAPGEEPAAKVALQSDDVVRKRLDELAANAGGTVAVEPVLAPAKLVHWSPPRQPPATLQAASFDRAVDSAWRRTSYTRLTAAAHESAPGVGSEPEEPSLADEPADGEPAAESDAAGVDQGLPSPMAGLPSGAGFGIVVHSVLERVDASAAVLRAELVERSTEVLAGRLTASYTAEELGAALQPALETPLGPLAGGVRLSDVAPQDRLAEMDFELPLAGGDDPVETSATVAAVADLLRRRLRPDDPFAAYPDRLTRAGVEHRQLRGYLTGSLDAVLRLGDDDGQSRYLVVDYKTNWLGARAGEPLTTGHYRPAALLAEMISSDYPLQLLLYLVALHRYLRWRQPGYDPAVHLGGVLYLYVRGMCGPATPVDEGHPAGVFSWSPPAALVIALSDLLDGSAA